MASSSLLWLLSPTSPPSSSLLSSYPPYTSLFAADISPPPRLPSPSKSPSPSHIQLSNKSLKKSRPPEALHCTKDAPEARVSTVQDCRFDSPNIVEVISRVGAIAIVVAGIVSTVDPVLAYKGGGPYGTEVTRGQDLSGRDFSGRTLVKQDFKTSILRQANFKGANLLGASFFDSDLTGADLSEADLRGADFSLANAAKANFTNANLEGALVTGNTSFRGAKIDGADFTDVYWRDDQREYLCRIADGVNPITGNATKDTLLCS